MWQFAVPLGDKHTTYYILASSNYAGFVVIYAKVFEVFGVSNLLC